MVRSTETVVTKISHPQDGAAAGSQSDGCLVVFYGQNIGRRYFLNAPELIIGRSDSAAILVDQDSVSRQHALLSTLDYKTWVEDRGSTNGTFVNNLRSERTELRDGDLLRVGQTIFKYLSGSNIENKYHEEIYKLSTIDGLTETYNKRYFIDTLERELNRAHRYGRGLSLAMFDIDHFKKINDSFGHLAGDHVLRELAAARHLSPLRRRRIRHHPARN
jgi:two-component system cell cycle response regulator